MKIDNGGDVSFYEDTGTTAKLFWDASAESLGIGTSSPAYPLEVQSGGVGTVLRAGTAFVSIDPTGSAAAPSLILNGDSNTGFWHPESDTLAVSTAGVERMRIDSGGNLGIGTSVMGARLNVETAASAGISYPLDIRNPQNAAGTGAGAMLRIHSTSDANRGIGIASLSTTNYATDNSMLFYTSASSTLIERMRIDSSGNLLMGTGSSVSRINLYPNSAQSCITTQAYTNGDVTLSFLNASGVNQGYIQTTATTVNYVSTSDPRLKTEFIEPVGSLDLIVQARESGAIGVFNFLAEPDIPVLGYNAHKLLDTQQGYGASEGQGPRDMAIGEVYEPAVIDEEGNEVAPAKTVTPAGVDQSKRVPLLEVAIYDLLKMNEALTARIEALEGAK
jgi:hypothetical protein